MAKNNGSKNKGPKPGAAEECLRLIAHFRLTEKGQPGRGEFWPIVDAAVKGRVVKKEATGLSDEMCSKALRAMPTGAGDTARTHTINVIEDAALAILVPEAA